LKAQPDSFLTKTSSLCQKLLYPFLSKDKDSQKKLIFKIKDKTLRMIVGHPKAVYNVQVPHAQSAWEALYDPFASLPGQ
jgi:hypothetical protein